MHKVLSVLQKVLQVTLGVHRYEKCDLIGDDMGDRYQCNGYNKTQVSSAQSHNVQPFPEDGD